MKKKLLVGIDVGGTKIAAGLVTPSGKILSRAKTSTPKSAPPAKIARLIFDLLNDILDSGDIRKKGLIGVGIGIPGIVDSDKGKIIRTPNMELSGTKFRDLLEKKLKTNVFLGNDVNVGLLGEKWLGAAQKANNVVGLFLGTGVGGGIILDGRLITGTHYAAAELGHMLIQDEGALCTCGNHGCLEALIGRWAIERDIKKALAQGKRSIITKLSDGKMKTLKSKVLRKALNKKDPLVTKIMTEASRHLGRACVTIRHIFDPEIIVLGGGVIEACGDFMLPIVKKIASKDRLFAKINPCAIASSQLGDDAIILGGAALAVGHFSP